jgi:sporulation protein YlmC with PRC-barrel domain
VNLLPLLGSVIAIYLAFALFRAPAPPEAAVPDSPLAILPPGQTATVASSSDSLIAALPQFGSAENEGKAVVENAADVLAVRRITSFIGRNVDSPRGDKLGEVKDLIVDETARITHAIVSYGGVGGLGATQVAIPWKILMDRAVGDHIVLDRSRLEAAPILPEGAPDAPDFTSRHWSREVDRYWEYEAAVHSVQSS